MAQCANLKKFIEAVRHDVEDIRAMLELMKRKDNIESRWQKAEAEVDRWATKLPQNDKEIGLRDAANAKAQELQSLDEIMLKVVMKHEVQDFWTKRLAEFRDNLSKFARASGEKTKEMAQQWSKPIFGLAG